MMIKLCVLLLKTHKPICVCMCVFVCVCVCYRVKLKEGVAFLGARATDPMAWSVSQGVASKEEGGVVTLHCRCRKVGTLGQRSVHSAAWATDFSSFLSSSSAASQSALSMIFTSFLSDMTTRREEVGGARRRLLQVDLEVTAFTAAWVGWQLEYPLGGSGHRSAEVTTTIRLAPQELGAIVPLAMVRTFICCVYIH